MSNTLRGDPVVDRIMQAVLARITQWERENRDMHISIIRSEQSRAIRIFIERRPALIAGERKYKSLTASQKQHALNFLRVLSSAFGLIETETVADERCVHTRSKSKTPGLRRNFSLPIESLTSAVTSHLATT